MKTRAWGHFLSVLIVGITLLLPSLASAGHVHRCNCPPQFVAYWGTPGGTYWDGNAYGGWSHGGPPRPYWGTPGGAYWDGNAYGGWSHGRPQHDGWHDGFDKGPHWGRHGGPHYEGYPRNQPQRHDFDQHPRWRR
jgi:hypothetical protein